MLIATRKDNLHPKEKFNSIIRQIPKEHSKKPDVVYNMIEKMYNGPYLELFSRIKKEGWISYGNENI